MKIIVKLACALLLWLLWKHTASMAYCLLFWVVTLAWAVSYLVQHKLPGRFLILCGITSNALVTSVNGGVMPAVGIPSSFQPAHPIWDVSGRGRWLLLADQAALYRFSIGDLLLITGGLLLLSCWAYKKVQRRNNEANAA